jgi:uncharacterized repeat protein (TIGR03806 family)
MRFWTFAFAAALVACGSEDDGEKSPVVVRPKPAPAGEPWQKLSEWGLFADIEAERAAETVIGFDVNSVLFADNAGKSRFMHVPTGERITFSDKERWELPLGTVLVKTFWFPEDARDASLGKQLIETRLLIHEPDGWISHVYLYADSQRDAELHDTGKTVDVSFIDAAGVTQQQKYNVPNVFDCQSCHGTTPDTHPLGPRTRQLDREFDHGKGPVNQIDHLAEIGWLDVTPPAERERLVDPAGTGPLVERARSYLDANCAHCHSVGGKAESTGFYVDYARTDPATGDPGDWGECKFPTSAGPATGGHTYDLVPGKPEESIVIHRVASIEPNVKMPPLLTRLSDAQGVAVLTDWIAAMPARTCE